MIAGAVVGAWLGADWVACLPKRNVQLGVDGALLLRQLELLTAVTLNRFFAAISTFGIGFYAPSA